MARDDWIFVKFNGSGTLELDFKCWLQQHASKTDLRKLLNIFVPQIWIYPENLDAVKRIDEIFVQMIDEYKDEWHKASVKYQHEYKDPTYRGNVLNDEKVKNAKPGTKKYTKAIVTARKRIERKNKKMLDDVKYAKNDYIKICELHSFYQDYKANKKIKT